MVITGASSGFDALSARAISKAGHTVYAGMRDVTGENAHAAKEATQFAREEAVDLRAIGMDILSQASVGAAISTIMDERGRLDVVIHNAGHMVFGPPEAFTAEQFSEQYDVNVLGTERVNRTALPLLCKQGQGLVAWVSSTSTREGNPPYLGPYFAAKAAMDSSRSPTLECWHVGE